MKPLYVLILCESIYLLKLSDGAPSAGAGTKLTNKITSNKLKTILDESEYEGDNPDWRAVQGGRNMTYEDWPDYSHDYTGHFGNYSMNDTEYLALYEDYLENYPHKTKRVKRAAVIETNDRLGEGNTRGKLGKAGEKHGKTGEKHGKTGEKHGKTGEKHGKASHKRDKTGKRHGKAGEKHGEAGEKHGTGKKHDKTGDKHDKVHEKEGNYSEQPGNAGEKHGKAQEKEGNSGNKGAEKQKKNGEKQEKDGESRGRNKTSQKVGIRKKFKMFVNAVRKRNNS